MVTFLVSQIHFQKKFKLTNFNFFEGNKTVSTINILRLTMVQKSYYDTFIYSRKNQVRISW